MEPKIKPIPVSPMVTIAEQSVASECYKRLHRWIGGFAKALKHDEEIGITITSAGKKIRVDGLGYDEPALIVFLGESDDGEKVVVVQHVSAIDVTLTKKKRKDPTAPRKPLGFASPPKETDT